MTSAFTRPRHILQFCCTIFQCNWWFVVGTCTLVHWTTVGSHFSNKLKPVQNSRHSYRRHFQVHFLVWKMIIFIIIYIRISQKYVVQLAIRQHCFKPLMALTGYLNHAIWLIWRIQFQFKIQFKNVYCHTNTVECIQYINVHKEYNTYMPIRNTKHVCP